MRQLVVSVSFTLLLAVAGMTQAPRTRELSPGVWFRQEDPDAFEFANCGWVILKDYVLVIDTNLPWGAVKILAEIRKTTNKPVRFLAITHYHFDHTFGGSIYTSQGAAMVGSEDAAMESRTKGRAYWDRNAGKGDFTGEFSLAPYVLVHPTITFPQKIVFDDGDRRVELIKFGPAHTKGDSVAWLPKEKLMFAGDLCVNSSQPGTNATDADADPANWIKALEEMVTWSPRAVICGHGALGDGATLRGQADYLSELWQRVQAGKKQGKSAEQLVRDIDLSRHRPWGADAEWNARCILAMYKKVN